MENASLSTCIKIKSLLTTFVLLEDKCLLRQFLLSNLFNICAVNVYTCIVDLNPFYNGLLINIVHFYVTNS